MQPTPTNNQPLSLQEGRMLADALGDTPETVISLHMLRRGSGRAYVAGSPTRFYGAIIQSTDEVAGREPMGFGRDATILWNLLRGVRGWTCIEVEQGCARALGSIIEAETGRRVAYLQDIYYAATKPVTAFHDDAVRLLTQNDLALLESAPGEIRGGGWGDTRVLLSEGIVAAALVEDRIVSLAHTYARSQQCADIGVVTLEQWRGRGFSTAAASLVAQEVQRAGQTPVWSTGETNYASLRVAQKLGLTEVARRVYVIPQP